MIVEIKKLYKDATLPKLLSPTAHVLNFFSYMHGTTPFFSNTADRVSTGVSIQLKDPNYIGLLMPNLESATTIGLVLRSGVRVIDTSFKGELFINSELHDPYTFKMHSGVCIAQIIFLKPENLGALDVIDHC